MSKRKTIVSGMVMKICNKRMDGTLSIARSVLCTGLAWGIFEATAGSILHQLPIAVGAYIWFPAAYFFMDHVYQKTGRKNTIVYTALLSAALKLLNLFSSIRLDYVINPAVAIMLESLAMVCVRSLASESIRRAPFVVVQVLCVNTLWRFGYMLYIGAMTPVWREVSVLQSAAAAFSFLIKENLLSSLVCSVALMFCHWNNIFKINAPQLNLAQRHKRS